MDTRMKLIASGSDNITFLQTTVASFLLVNGYYGKSCVIFCTTGGDELICGRDCRSIGGRELEEGFITCV